MVPATFHVFSVRFYLDEKIFYTLLVLLVTYIMSVWPPLTHWYFNLHSVHNTSRTICIFGNIVAAQIISARPNIQKSMRAFCRFCEDCLHCPAMSVSGKGESTPWRPHRCNRGNAQYIPETWVGGREHVGGGCFNFQKDKIVDDTDLTCNHLQINRLLLRLKHITNRHKN